MTAVGFFAGCLDPDRIFCRISVLFFFVGCLDPDRISLLDLLSDSLGPDHFSLPDFLICYCEGSSGQQRLASVVRAGGMNE